MNFLIPDKEPKLTEAEIMKALECHKSRSLSKCSDCPYLNIYGCAYQLSEEALAIITDKNDSIEMYRRNIALLDEQILAKDKEIADMHRDVKSAEEYAWQMKTEKENLIKTYKECQAEAIKEVLQRARGKLSCIPQHHFTFAQVLCDLDQIAKEMGVEL